MKISLKTKNVITNYFAYLGGLFILAGIGVYLGTFWDDLSTAERILTTAGTGFGLYVLAVIFSLSAPLAKAVTPLVLVAAPLQCSGLYVAADELQLSWSFQDTSLAILGVMSFQYLATFWSTRRTAILLAALFFTVSFLGVWFDRLLMEPELIAFLLGLSLLSVSHIIGQSPHRAISGVGYFFGSGMFFFGSFELLEQNGIELLFLGLACLMLYLSTVVKSRPLLSSSCLALLTYVGYYTDLHFVNSLTWPIALLVLGFVFIALSVAILRSSLSA